MIAYIFLIITIIINIKLLSGSFDKKEIIEIQEIEDNEEE